MEQEILLLNKLGLSDIEAKVYLTILQKGNLSGYETSKLAGVSRSKIYNFLENLIKKGFLIYQVKENNNLYSAVPIEEITNRIQHEIGNVVENLNDRLSIFPIQNDMNEVWHIRNRENIFAKCRHVISETKEELLLQIWERDIPEILEEL